MFTRFYADDGYHGMNEIPEMRANAPGDAAYKSAESRIRKTQL